MDGLLVIYEVGVEEDCDSKIPHWVTFTQELEVKHHQLTLVIEHDVVAPKINMDQRWFANLGW